jgi:hypothetical protein
VVTSPLVERMAQTVTLYEQLHDHVFEVRAR